MALLKERGLERNDLGWEVRRRKAVRRNWNLEMVSSSVYLCSEFTHIVLVIALRIEQVKMGEDLEGKVRKVQADCNFDGRKF